MSATSGLKVREQERVVVVSFNDRELRGDEQIQQVAADLTQVLASMSTGMRLLLDFQNVERVSSSMIGDLVALNKKALRKGVSLQLCRLSADVMRVVETCHLDRVFKILDDPPL